MKRIFCITVFLILGLSTIGHALENWTVEPRLFFGTLYPTSKEWEDLYGGDDLHVWGLTVDSVLYRGFGPYVSLSPESAETKFKNKIKVTLDMTTFSLGPQWRYVKLPWFEPAARAGWVYYTAKEEFDDEYLKYGNKDSGSAFEAAVDLNFYPLYPVNPQGIVRGFLLSASGVYRFMQFGKMGKLEDVSGLGYQFGFGYKWTFGEKKPGAETKTKELIAK